MRILNKVIVSIFALYALLIFLAIHPMKIYPLTAVENKTLHCNEQLSLYIEKFKQEEGRLPMSFEEIGNNGRSKASDDLSFLVKKSNAGNEIVDYTGKHLTFEIEAAWEDKENDELVWAKTKDGKIIRFRKRLLQERG